MRGPPPPTLWRLWRAVALTLLPLLVGLELRLADGVRVSEDMRAVAGLSSKRANGVGDCVSGRSWSAM